MPSWYTGCGLWNPEADALAALREDIDENASRWKEILRASEMRRCFLNEAPDDDDAVVEAFVHHNRETALKTKPKVGKIFSSISHQFLRDYFQIFGEEGDGRGEGIMKAHHNCFIHGMVF